jgi:hypothetical protein
MNCNEARARARGRERERERERERYVVAATTRHQLRQPLAAQGASSIRPHTIRMHRKHETVHTHHTIYAGHYIYQNTTDTFLELGVRAFYIYCKKPLTIEATDVHQCITCFFWSPFFLYEI